MDRSTSKRAVNRGGASVSKPHIAVFRLCLCLLIDVSCCGHPTEETPGETSRSVLDVIRFQGDEDIAAAYSERLFEQSARKAFQNVKASEIAVKSSLLQGAMQKDEDKTELLVSIEIRLKGISAPLETSLIASAGASRPPAFLADKALSDLAAAVSDLLHLVHAAPKQLTHALSSSEPDMQIFAAALIAERHIDTAPAQKELCHMLSDPREKAAEAAADALKKIGTPQTVPQIIQSIKRGNLRSEVRVLEIIARQ